MCPFCYLQSKNLDELKKHIENVHSINEGKPNKQDSIKQKNSEVCSNCASKHANKYLCEECGNYFVNNATLGSHIQSKHNKPSYTEPFPCEGCGLVLASFNLLQEHVNTHHSPVQHNCKYCDFRGGDEELFDSHLVESHAEVVILHSMAKQVEELHSLNTLNWSSQMF